MTIWRHLAASAFLESDRLILRPFRYEDALELYSITSHLGSLDFLFPAHKSLQETEEMLSQRIMAAPLGKWAIEDKSNQKLIGWVYFEHLSEKHKTTEVTYLIRKNYRNKGFMTEALSTVVNLALQKWELDRVELITHLENHASQLVAKKVGFQVVKQYKGSDRYSRRMRKYLLFRKIK